MLRMTGQISMALEPAVAADLADIAAQLEQEGLPNKDLAIRPGARFWVARTGDRLLGAIGLETYGSSGLLRSLVVVPEARSTGLGGRLVEALEQAAKSAGLHRLVLLTQTAEAFFAKRGYAVIDRASAPDEVRASTEFRTLCPASATCMSKTLRDPP
jgi:N-acetylglutamate synthase-like GNAT family acetyltransferase